MKTQTMMTKRLLHALIRAIAFTMLFISPIEWLRLLCLIIATLNGVYALTLLPKDITKEPVEENKG
jgi:hypothetical protein